MIQSIHPERVAFFDVRKLFDSQGDPIATRWSMLAEEGAKREEKRMNAGIAANLRNCISNSFTALGVKRGTPKAG